MEGYVVKGRQAVVNTSERIFQVREIEKKQKNPFSSLFEVKSNTLLLDTYVQSFFGSRSKD